MDVKRCSKCAEEKPHDQFYAQRARPDGLCPWCKACHSAHSKARYAEQHQKVVERQRVYDREHADERRDKHLRRLYGITLAEYLQRLADQGNACAVCRRAFVPGAPRNKAVCVDHDHDTGQVRGLLCHSCNRGLGLLGDNPEVVQRALAYLLTTTRSGV